MGTWAGRILLFSALAIAFLVAIAATEREEPSAEVVDKGPQVDSGTTLESLTLEPRLDGELERPAQPSARYVVLRDDLASGPPDLVAIRRANPGAQILVAKNAAFTFWEEAGDGFLPDGSPRCPFEPYQGSGVDYCVANPNEDWFLHTADDPSQRMTSSGFAGQWAMNPGNEDYRQAWIDAVLARLHDVDRDGVPDEGPEDRYDGVWMDDVNVRPGHGLAAIGIDGMPVDDPAFPDGDVPAFREGMVGFIDEVSGAIRDDGFVTMANVEADIYDPAQRNGALSIAADLDVFNQERFFRLYTEGPDGTVQADLLFTDPPAPDGSDWSDWIDFMRQVQATGASYAGITYGRDDDIAAQQYVRASFLIGWDGTDGSAQIFRSFDRTPGGPLGLEAWTESVGTPAGEAEQVGTGWRRNFSDGVVLINPATTGGEAFGLAGRYRTPDGRCPRTLTLGPVDARVLPTC